MRVFLMLSLLIAFSTSCQTTGNVEISSPPPDWIRGGPGFEDKICAIGTSGPTYYKKDAKKYAAENARKELARTIKIDINTIMVEVVNNESSTIDEATVMQASSWATSTVVENSKIIDYWYDAEGVVSQKNVTYALVCMPGKYTKDKT